MAPPWPMLTSCPLPLLPRAAWLLGSPPRITAARQVRVVAPLAATWVLPAAALPATAAPPACPALPLLSAAPPAERAWMEPAKTSARPSATGRVRRPRCAPALAAWPSCWGRAWPRNVAEGGRLAARRGMVRDGEARRHRLSPCWHAAPQETNTNQDHCTSCTLQDLQMLPKSTSAPVPACNSCPCHVLHECAVSAL